MTEIIKDNTIFKVEDYTLFKRIDGNRRLNKSHIKRLAEAFSKDPNCIRYNPILINKKRQIIDGQHRFEACKELGLPIYFIIEDDLTLEDVQALNANTKNWSPVDYALSYAELGNVNYQTYLTFKKSFGLNHDVLMRYLSLDTPITGESFKLGKMKVNDPTKSADYCQKLTDTGQYFERYNMRSYALGFLKIVESDKYDHSRMLTKLAAKASMLDVADLPEDYARQLEAIFNHGLPEQNKVRLY